MKITIKRSRVQSRDIIVLSCYSVLEKVVKDLHTKSPVELPAITSLFGCSYLKNNDNLHKTLSVESRDIVT